MFINNSFFFFFLGVIFNWDPYIIWEQEVGVAQGALDKVLYREAYPMFQPVIYS